MNSNDNSVFSHVNVRNIYQQRKAEKKSGLNNLKNVK